MTAQVRVAALAAVPVLAFAAGGAVSRGGQGLALVAMGLVMLLFPPRQSVPRWLAAGLAAWLLLLAAAFLPAWGMEGPGSWRAALEATGVLKFGPLRTVQPWLTLEALAVAAAGAAWALYLTTQPLDDRERAQLLKAYLLGIAAVAVLALLAQLSGTDVPFWGGAPFGPFPNRNQTGNVFALAGVLAFVLGLRQLHHGRRKGWVWIGVLGVCLVAVLVNGSRAGLLLLPLGIAGWLVADAMASRRFTRAAMGASAALLLAALALVAGGEALERAFASLGRAGEWTENARWKIQKDAFGMAAAHPLLGVGLGNFDGVFALHRGHFRDYSRPIHPESDWAWLAAEAGFPAALLLAALALFSLRTCWPQAAQKERRLRLGACVALAAFLLHSLLDVPGHRLGSLLPALMLLPLAWPPRPLEVPGLPLRATAALAGLGLLALGGWFMAQALDRVPPTGRHKVGKLLAAVKGMARGGPWAEVLNACDDGRRTAPLEWRFHFHAARARLKLNVGASRAAQEFRAFRLLEPDSPFTVLQEGQLWVGRGEPDFALEAWRAALERKQDGRKSVFREMLEAARKEPGLFARLPELAEPYPELEFYFLESAPDEVFDRHLAALLARPPADSGLEPRDLEAFLDAWRRRRGDAAFLREVAPHPAWARAGWSVVGQACANTGDFIRALHLADEALPAPTLPVVRDGGQRARELLERYPDDLAAGTSLALIERSRGEWDKAAARLARLTQHPDAPAYLWWLQAEALRKLDRPAEAWKALQHYLERMRRPSANAASK